MFVSMYKVDLLCIPVLAGYHYIVDVLCSFSGTFSLITWIRCSWKCFVGCVCPSVVVEPWLLLSSQWVWLTLRLTGYEDCPWPQHMSYYVGADLIYWVCPSSLWCPIGYSLRVPLKNYSSSILLLFSEARQWVRWFWGSWEGFQCRPMPDAARGHPRLPVRSYNVILCLRWAWSCGIGHTTNWCWLPPV